MSLLPGLTHCVKCKLLLKSCCQMVEMLNNRAIKKAQEELRRKCIFIKEICVDQQIKSSIEDSSQNTNGVKCTNVDDISWSFSDH